MADFEKDLDNFAELLENAGKTEEVIKSKNIEGDNEMNELFKTILELGPEGLKKAMDELTTEQGELLMEALEEMKKASIIPEKITDAPQAKPVMGKVDETIIQEDKADDDADEKLVDPKNKKVKHQGDASVQEGEKIGDIEDGAVIKEVEANKDQTAKIPEQMKKAKPEGVEKIEIPKKDFKDEHDKLIPILEEGKPKEQKKEAKKQKEEVKEELDMAKAYMKIGEEEAKAKKERKKEEEAPKKEEPEKSESAEIAAQTDLIKEEPKPEIKKSVVWDDPQKLLKACTQGRNFHASVNDMYDEALENAKKTPEEIKKSDKYDVNEVIEQKLDKSVDQITRVAGIRDHKNDESVKLVKSFEIKDMTDALGMTEEDVKKILGE